MFLPIVIKVLLYRVMYNICSNSLIKWKQNQLSKNLNIYNQIGIIHKLQKFPFLFLNLIKAKSISNGFHFRITAKFNNMVFFQIRAAAELALSVLPHAASLNQNEIQRGIQQCKEESDSMLEKACDAVEKVGKSGHFSGECS